jgi:FMN reductase [NAD(P)H]
MRRITARALIGESNKDLVKESRVSEGYAVQCAIIVGYATAENKFSLGERTKKGRLSHIE